MTTTSTAALKRKLKKKTEELKLLHRITETISYNLNISEVLDEIVSLVSGTMKSDACLIYLAQDSHLILKASKIPHPGMINKMALEFGVGITGWVAQYQKTVALNKEAYNDKRFAKIAKLDEDNWEAFISMPIIYQKKLIGVINVQNKKARRYTKDHIRMLEIIAAQVGGALSNAKLISETITLKETLQTRKVLEKAKGMVMKHYNKTEEEAYQMIRKKAMNTKKTMKDIAQAIILTLDS